MAVQKSAERDCLAEKRCRIEAQPQANRQVPRFCTTAIKSILLTAMAQASHGPASTAAAAPSSPGPVSGTTTVSSEPLTSAAAQGSLTQRCLPRSAASLPQCQWCQPGDCCCCLLLSREHLQREPIMLSCLIKYDLATSYRSIPGKVTVKQRGVLPGAPRVRTSCAPQPSRLQSLTLMLQTMVWPGMLCCRASRASAASTCKPHGMQVPIAPCMNL